MGCGASKATPIAKHDVDSPRAARGESRAGVRATHPASPASLASEDGDSEFFDARDAPLTTPSFMRARSLERLKSIDEDREAHQKKVKARSPSMTRWLSTKEPEVVAKLPDSSMRKCVVPLFDRGMETLADESSNASWSANVDGVGFKLRGKTYKQDKKKVPSAAPFYNVKAVLAFKSDEKVGDWIRNLFADDLGFKIKGQVPSVMIVNIMVPDYKPTGGFLAKKENDGPGHNVVLLCKISDFARETLEKTDNWDELPADFKLLVRYVKGDGTGKVDVYPHEMAVRQQTKMVVMVVTGHEHLPWLVRQAVNHGNGKPFMVNRTSSYVERSGALEVNVDAHNFSNVALNGLRTVHSSLGKLILDVGATVQGENESELPERLLFSCRVNYAKIELIEAHVDMLEEYPSDRAWLTDIREVLK